MAYSMKRGDTGPPLRAKLRDQRGAIPLHDADVFFQMRQVEGKKVVRGSCIVIDAVAGLVEYDWAPTDTDTPGIFHGEWEIVFAPGTAGEVVRTVPNDGYEEFVILDDLDE